MREELEQIEKALEAGLFYADYRKRYAQIGSPAYGDVVRSEKLMEEALATLKTIQVPSEEGIDLRAPVITLKDVLSGVQYNLHHYRHDAICDPADREVTIRDLEKTVASYNAAISILKRDHILKASPPQVEPSTEQP